MSDDKITPKQAQASADARAKAETPKAGKAADDARAEARQAELDRQQAIVDAVADLRDPGTEEAEPARVAAPRSVSWINPGNPGHDPETGEPV